MLYDRSIVDAKIGHGLIARYGGRSSLPEPFIPHQFDLPPMNRNAVSTLLLAYNADKPSHNVVTDFREHGFENISIGGSSTDDIHNFVAVADVHMAIQSSVPKNPNPA